MTRVVLGLGSNLGDRLLALQAAAARVDAEVAPVVRGSRVWESAPIGPPQPDFLNAALLVEWPSDRDLGELLAGVLSIEATLGRVRAKDAVRWGPRAIDLDILWADGVTIDRAPELVVPHPHLAERAFAVIPLLEVAPDAGYAVPEGVGELRPTPWSLDEYARR